MKPNLSPIIGAVFFFLFGTFCLEAIAYHEASAKADPKNLTANSDSILLAKDITIDVEKKAPLKKPIPAGKLKKKKPRKKTPEKNPQFKADDLEDPFDEEFGEAPEIDDRFETFNRWMFGFNETLEDYFFDPLTRGYRWAVPESARLAVKNIFSNAGTPVNLISSALQGNMEKTGTVLGRFVINSSVGLGGMFDVADEYVGLKPVHEDFDQALGTRGVPSGPYLVLPIFGPSSSRHAVGRTVDGFLNPVNYFLPFLGMTGLSVGEQVNSYSFYLEDKKALDRDALDRYESIKHFYYHNREKQVRE